jgi:hypothetical protein
LPPQGADLFFCKTFRADVLMTVIFFDTTFYCTLTDASEEQALVDTLFPNIYGRQNGMQVCVCLCLRVVSGGCTPSRLPPPPHTHTTTPHTRTPLPQAVCVLWWRCACAWGGGGGVCCWGGGDFVGEGGATPCSSLCVCVCARSTACPPAPFPLV